MKIIEYKDANNIVVEFLDDFHSKVKTTWRYFQNGLVNNPFDKTVQNFGFIGNQEIRDSDGTLSSEYRTWFNMIHRCMMKNTRSKDLSYDGCSICEEWQSFEEFRKWIRAEPNFEKWKELDDKALDKDILIKGNKIYSPDTCVLVPQNINIMFTKRERDRGIYPIGVSYHRRGKYFSSSCSNPFSKKLEHLGCFNNPYDAFIAYKNRKEHLIKEMAMIAYNNGTISKKCYDAMVKYIVEIDD